MRRAEPRALRSEHVCPNSVSVDPGMAVRRPYTTVPSLYFWVVYQADFKFILFQLLH